MKYFRTGDPEPEPAVRVLLHHVRTAAQATHLARFQHGWRWVRSKAELDRGDATPLTWRFAMAAERDGAATEVRTMNDAEHVDWLAS
jgi:hypothetical protein